MVELEEISGVADELLEVHGIAPGRKAEGVTRLIYENVDGFNNRITNNDKLDKAKDLIDELQADLVAHCEPKIRICHKLNQNGMRQMFNGGKQKSEL